MTKKRVFEKTVLDSGIKVLSEKIPHLRSATVGFWLGTGSRDEPPSVSGMSHFLEHLLFKGTRSRTAKEISDIFESLGAEFNAFSAKEYICLYTRLVDEYIPVGIEIFSDLLQNPRLAEKDIKSEREVILEEIRMYEDSPDEKIHDLFASALFKNHPLGKSILGESRTVSSFDRERVKSFFAQNYVPGNIAVAAAGSLEHQDITDLINKHFKPGRKFAHRRQEVSLEPNSRVKIHNKKTEQAHLCLGMPSVKAGDESRFALAVLDNILGGGMSSRIYQEIREKRGLAYSAYSYHALYSETGLLAVYAGTKPSKLKEVIELIRLELNKLASFGVEEKELKRAKDHLKGQLVLELESTSQRMTRLARAELTHKKILDLDELIKRINKVTLDDMGKLAESIFSPEKLVLTVIGPFEESDFAGWLKG